MRVVSLGWASDAPAAMTRADEPVAGEWLRAQARGRQEDDCDVAAMARTLCRVLAGLTPREEYVIRRRFGLGCGTAKYGEDACLWEVGKELGVCAERVRNIEAGALCKMRHPRRTNVLAPKI